MHRHGLVHRDVKDANVMAAASRARVTLIDFGFCKGVDRRTIRSGDSFWRVGAARFSPPAKLHNPGLALPAHDVFAAGVIAYRLLTGDYPWAVDEQGDVGALRELQLTRPPDLVIERNSHVIPRVSALVAKLIRVDDDRPSADEALNDVRGILDEVRSSPRKLARGKSRTPYPVVLRDPIYGDVWLTDYEQQVADTKEMQRLRYIRQLGLTHLVFPGADHSRFSHAIGSVAQVEKIFHTMETHGGQRIDDQLRLAARLYALTHDVTRIPFGHILENEFGFFPPFDANAGRAERLLFRETSELGRLLRVSDAGRTVLQLFEVKVGARSASVITDLVTGLTGADVLDYIDRDAFYCGLNHRIDSAIFRQFHLHPLLRSNAHILVSMVGGRYGLRVDREFVVEDLLEDRYAMYLKVYTNKDRIAASALLAKGLSHIVPPRGSKRRSFRKEAFEQAGMGDDMVLDRMQRSTNKVTAWTAEQVVRRKLPRCVYRASLLASTGRNEANYADRQIDLKNRGLFSPWTRSEIEAEIAKSARLDPRQVMIYCPSSAPGYQRVEHWVARARNASPSRQAPGSGVEVARRHLGLWELCVFVSEADERGWKVVAAAAQQEFGFVNMIDAGAVR